MHIRKYILKTFIATFQKHLSKKKKTFLNLIKNCSPRPWTLKTTTIYTQRIGYSTKILKLFLFEEYIVCLRIQPGKEGKWTWSQISTTSRSQGNCNVLSLSIRFSIFILNEECWSKSFMSWFLNNKQIR